MKTIDPKGKDLRMMGVLMDMPLYLDVSKQPTAERKDQVEQQARAILYQATQALVKRAETELPSEENQQ